MISILLLLQHSQTGKKSMQIFLRPSKNSIKVSVHDLDLYLEKFCVKLSNQTQASPAWFGVGSKRRLKLFKTQLSKLKVKLEVCFRLQRTSLMNCEEFNTFKLDLK